MTIDRKAALARVREDSEGQQQNRKEGPLAWLETATRVQILAWIAAEVPSGSKAEAVSKLKLLDGRVRAEAPGAALALSMIAKLIARLEGEPDGRPFLSPPGDLLEVTVRTWETIVAWGLPHDPRRFLARFGDAIVRLERSDTGALGTMPLDSKRTVNLLARVARWGRIDPALLVVVRMLASKLTDAHESDLIAAIAAPQPPPLIVAQNLLADPEMPLPVLERVVEVPVLAPDGTVHEQPGYDPSSRCFYAPTRGLDVPPVSERPTAGDLAHAKELILDDLIGDFPFVTDAERAGAVAFLLEPFVRVLIDGSTPLYLFEAPTPGTGKTLLVEALAVPTLGSRRLTLMAEARDPDEWRKRLTAKLRNAPAFLVIDNLRRALDAGALAMTLTAGVVEDRLLGVSETVTLPVRCTIAATANNPTLSDEMARRTVRIRLDSGLERPEQREAFRHPNLLAWAREHRGELIWAALTLARAWAANGRPAGPEKPLGSFEAWTQVIGGILHIAGIEGLLANAADLRAESQDTTHADLLQAVHAAKGDGDFSSAEIVSIATPIVGLGDVSDQVAAQRLGTRLRDMVDRPISGLVLRRGSNPHGSRRWRVASLATPPPQPTPTQNAASDSSGGGGGSHPDQATPKDGVLAELMHEQPLEHWRARRAQNEHVHELETGAPTLAELDPEELLNAFPGTELERTDVDRAAEVIACALTGSHYVIGQWCPSAPIRRGLAVTGITDETTIQAALNLLKVQVRQQGATGARWRLERNPELPRPAIERTAECRCGQRSREWRLATGGAWTCALCHPPADGLEVEHRSGAENPR